ncbi:MAG: hypothetical protein AAF667_02580 [Pseudomonadota bacterium]
MESTYSSSRIWLAAGAILLILIIAAFFVSPGDPTAVTDTSGSVLEPAVDGNDGVEGAVEGTAPVVSE